MGRYRLRLQPNAAWWLVGTWFTGWMVVYGFVTCWEILAVWLGPFAFTIAALFAWMVVRVEPVRRLWSAEELERQERDVGL
jgi:hypothetical protein